MGSFERKGHFEDEKGNGIAVTVPPKAAGIALEIQEEGKAKRYTITDELSELSEVYNTNFTIMSPLSYFGRRRCGKNARYLFALVFDLDGVGMPQLRDTLHQMNKEIIPKATFVVNSGTGLHLYYVLQEPIPMYPHNQKCLKELKYSLTRQIWNRYTSTIKEPQVQGILQGFRVVGSGSKLGRDYPVTAYRLGGRVTIEKLLEFIPDSNGEQQQHVTNEQIKKAVEKLNKSMMSHSEAVFGIHEATNRVTIKIIDKDTKKVIKELPPEKTLDMIAKVWELAGILVDEKR